MKKLIDTMKFKLFIFFLLFSQISFSQIDSLIYYFNKGDYSKAINYGEKQKITLKVKDSNYAILVNYLASAYSRISDAKNAELNYLEELELEKSFFGENDKITAQTYYSLGNVSLNHEKAKDYFLKAIDILSKNNETKSQLYCLTLSSLAFSYKNLGENQKAETSYLLAIEILLEINGEKDTVYQQNLVYLAMFYNKINNFPKSEEYFLKSYTLQKQNLKSETLSTFIFTVDTIALYYNNKNLLDLSEKFYLESVELKEKYYGKNNMEFINSLINIGMLYTFKNQIEKSKSYLVQAHKELININKEYSVENAFVLNSIATKQAAEGKYIESEKLYLEIIDIYERLKETKEKYYEAKMNLAYNYFNQGDFNNAEKIYDSLGKLDLDKSPTILFDILEKTINFYLELENVQKVSDLVKKFENVYLKIKPSLKEFDFEHITFNRTMQMYNSLIGNNKEALNFALKRLDLIEKNPLFESISNAYQTALSDIGYIYKKNGNYVDWRVYKFKAYGLIKDKIGKSPRNDASSLLDIANIYNYENDIINAEKYYNQAIKLIEEKVNVNINLYEDSLLYLSSFYIDNKSEKVNSVLIKLFLKTKNDIDKFISFMSSDEFEKIRFLKVRYRLFSYYQLQSHPTQYPEINSACFENELLLKNLSLRNQQRIKTTIEKNGDANVKEKYQQFIENKRYITKLDELPISERPNTHDQLKTDTENLEKELTRLSSTFADAKKSLSINWKQIQEKLKPNEVAIDLVSYNYYNKKWTDSIMYAAFVIKKDSKFPKYITLFEQKQLATLLERNNKEPDSIQSKILNKQYSDKTIGNLFYKPLEQELKGCKTIYLAPSGLTHQINFKALSISDNQTFGEQFEINLVGSTASMLDYKPTSFRENKNLELILYGGIDYNKKSDEIKTDENKIGFNDLVLRSGISDFGYLKGTNEEVYKIVNNAKTFNYKTILKTEREATEESIKQLDGKTTPFVLHLATHGFFFENVEQEKPVDFKLMEENTKRKIYKSSEDPMMRSGLIFAGANKYWGNTNEATETDDGILTAKEISNLDLSNCQLVVLSACETGLGQVNGSEGVFGLQRAFKMAGVKNIIMSLWKVPDAQTAELFELFYSECFSGKSIQEAFQSTQAKMKAKYSPYYWASFVLLE